MAKSQLDEEGPDARKGAGGYFAWSCDPAVGLLAVMPLWMVYEAARLFLAPAERNGAEALLLQQFDRFGGHGLLVLRASFALLTVFAARSLLRRGVPWLRVAAVLILEGTIYGLMLGPIASQMTSSTVRLLSAGALSPTLTGNLVGSLGAGIFEELVFRLGLMSALVWVGLRVVRAWSLPPWLAGIFAVIVSALVFSWFHHFCGEKFDATRFLFWTMAGLLLGLLMWGRGYGVCVYTHTVYNIYFYLAGDGS